MPMMPSAWAEIIGGDALGRGHEPALCWWLPDGASVQHAYRVRTDDGLDTGRMDSQVQSFVRLPVFDRSRRSAAARVKVWSDLGESGWSDPVALEAALLDATDWSARWIGVAEGQNVDLVADGSRLIIEAVPRRWRLEDLLVNVTPEAMREAFDWGEDVGREIVDG